MTSETAVSIADPGLAGLLAAYDAAFAADRADDVAELFADDARLQWPRRRTSSVAKRSAWPSPSSWIEFHTVSWEPSYQVAEVHGERAFLLGRFVELRAVRRSGELERVPGRLVLVCRQEGDGAWRITHAISSRYGETTDRGCLG